MKEEIQKIKDLIKHLSDAAKAYYQESREIMSNFEYDKLYDELSALEEKTGIILSNSPTQKVGYEVLSSLPKEAHDTPMLSLDKTKSEDSLAEWLGGQKGLLSWKLDGLTIVLTYRGGKLEKAVTRGNGEIGEVITNNAKVFSNIPITISYLGELILRGEAIIRYSVFNRINNEIGDLDAKYKNPRNLCSGTVRQLNNEITAKRNVDFYAFSLVKIQDAEFQNSREAQLLWLRNMGFEVVEFKTVTQDNLKDMVSYFAESIPDYDIPSDGLVLNFDDINYGISLGHTSKYPRDAIAYKWTDEISETKLRYIEWSPSRTGLINPVAVFEPVELEGSTVSRASVHNISILEALSLGEGDTITVYKANMIIPQIADNLTRSGTVEIPEVCPVCGGETQISQINDVKSLYCVNSDCEAKKIKRFSLLVSRDALNIDGLSEATLEKFIAAGYIKEFSDLFVLEQFKDEIVTMEGFGQRSYDNIITSIEIASHTTLPRFVYGLGIANIGLSNAKMLSKAFRYDFNAMRNVEKEELVSIDGIGEIIADSFIRFFADDKNNQEVDDLLKHLFIEEYAQEEGGNSLDGLSFVITGSVEHFANRKELQSIIESKGGKVTGSVTAKTSYLINNDVTSKSSKNKKAKELNVPIITEADVIELLKEKNMEE